MTKFNYYSTILFLILVASCTIYDISEHRWKFLIIDIVFGVVFTGIAIVEKAALIAEAAAKEKEEKSL